MLTRITGRLESLEGNAAIVTPVVGGNPDATLGVALTVLLPAAIVTAVTPRVGSIVTLHTIHVLEPQGGGTSFTPRLIGFDSPDDRRFFELFTTVKGLGNRKALRALILPTSEVARAIYERDAKKLKTLPEVGPRLADTIIAELNGKVDPFLDHAAASATGPADAPAAGVAALDSPAAKQAVDALLRLGAPRDEAERKVETALRDAAPDASADDLLAATFALP
ncbi:MAG: Holliday junction branch migration protein RuvA [Phycisphaerales bacterium]